MDYYQGWVFFQAEDGIRDNNRVIRDFPYLKRNHQKIVTHIKGLLTKSHFLDLPGERVVGWCGFLFFTNCMRGKTDMRQYLDALERIMNEGVARDGRNGRTVALFGI